MLNFDTFPVTYLIPVYILCWGLLWLTLRKNLDTWLFLVLAFGLLFLLRLPSIAFDGEINPDESQMITQAMTLRQDPLYFRSVDGTTGGPLNSYFLVIPSLLGLPFDFITAHLSAFVLVMVNLILLFFTARQWFGEPIARLILLPILFLFGLTQHIDFLHYNSELIAVVLLNGSYYLFARLLTKEKPSARRIAVIGLLLGMVPFGKLQSVPLIAVVGCFVAYYVLTHAQLTVRQKGERLIALGGGGLAFPLLVVILTSLFGVFNDLVTYYILGNLRYSAQTDQLAGLLDLPVFFKNATEFDWVMALLTVFGGIAAIRFFRRTAHRPGALRIPQSRVLWFLLSLIFAALFAITRTGNAFGHYLFFLIGPLMLLLGYCLWLDTPSVQVTAPNALYAVLLAIFLLAFGVKGVYRYSHNIALNTYPSDHQGGWKLAETPVAAEVLKYAHPGEKLVVWGWRNDYYVQTQMPQGVAENHSLRSVFNHPMLAQYQQRYYQNFIRSTPPVFVDAVGSQNLWMTNRATQGHEIIKPLDDFVKAHYQYIGLVNDSRIYVRNDRMH